MNVSHTGLPPTTHTHPRPCSIQADGFGIGWYDPQNDTHAAPKHAEAPRAERPAKAVSAQRAEAEEAAEEIWRKREKELDLENERPCIFKSISPVR